jgi:hypothetical protein
MARKQNIRILSFFAIILIIPCLKGMSQNLPQSGIVPDIFQSDKPIRITIKTDLFDLISHKGKEEYQPARIIYSDEKHTDSLNLKIRVRGTFRKDTINCDFPPLRLNFKRKEVMNTIFGPQDRFRIVTHCRTYDKQFVQYVLREYYVYKIYKILNPLSLNVRMALITYEDSRGRVPVITRYGFILEDEDEFASRYNMHPLTEKLSLDSIEKNNERIMALFQFMIGNTDWIVPFGKNLIFLKQGLTTYCVPYDFDYCGIVNTDYRNILGYKSLSEPERIYKGRCCSNEELMATVKYFKKSRKQIYHILMHSTLLNHESFIYMYNYLTEFYSIISSKSERRKYFFANCNNK